jgi:FkbH-like protein
MDSLTPHFKELKIGVVTDFTPHNFARLLERNCLPFRAQCHIPSFGPSLPALLDQASEFWETKCDAIVIWTFPELAVPEFYKVLNWMPFSLENILAQVDEFVSVIEKATTAIPLVIVPTWTAPAYVRGLGPLEMRNRLGVSNTLMRMNLRLADRIESNSRIILLEAQPWLQAAGADSFSPRLWYRSKTPFRNEVFDVAAKDIAAVLAASHGQARKLIVVDLDNTLWSGVVGDVGWENLRLGGHDPIGEAYADFQRVLKRLTKRGILLAISSKNEESVALEAIEKHPGMILRRDDFVDWRINWKDKAENLVDLLGSLNLGMDSAVFIDDSRFERGRVREALPDVLVPELPEDPLAYPLFLQTLRCFDSPVLSQEDRLRTAMYVADRKRLATKSTAGSLQDWLDGLELAVNVRDLQETDVARVLQLFQRTNQMNLSTRRLTKTELLAWLEHEFRRLWTFEISDRFGDYGLCGIVSVEQTDNRILLRDFLLSCRVFGRGIEEAMLAVAAQYATALDHRFIHAEFVPTAKNAPCEKWLQGRPSTQRHGNVFSIDAAVASIPPSHIQFRLCSDGKTSVVSSS